MDVIPLVIAGVTVAIIATLFADFNRRKKGLRESPRYLALVNPQVRVLAMSAVVNEANQLWAKGDQAEAIRRLEAWRDTEPDVPDGDVRLIGYHLLGLYLAATNRLPDAVPLLVQSLTYYESPNVLVPSVATTQVAIAHDEIARYHTIVGNIEAKQEHYLRAAEAWHAGDKRAYAARAYGHYHSNRGENLVAAERYAEAFAHAPADADPAFRWQMLLQQAMCLFSVGHYSASLAVMRRVVADYTPDAIGSVGCQAAAFVFARNDYFDEARGWLTAAEARNEAVQDIAHTVNTWGLVLLYEGKYADSLARCDDYRASTAAKNEPVSAQVLMSYGNALSVVGRFGDAIAAHELAIQNAPVTDTAAQLSNIACHHLALAIAHGEQGEYERGLAHLRDAGRNEQIACSLAHYFPAICLHLETRAGTVSPDAARTDAHRQLDALRNAASAFPTPTDARRFYADTVAELARTLLIAGFPGDALTALAWLTEDGATASPGALPQWLYWRGRCHEAMDDAVAARHDYEAVVELAEPGTRHATDAAERLARR